MKTLKKLTAFLIIAILALQTVLVASAAEDTINLVVDPDAKTLTVQGTSSKGDKFLLGMLLYDTDAYKTNNTVAPLSIFDCRTNAQGEYKFDSIKFGAGSYLKMLTVRVDIGDEVVEKETVIAFEDSTGSDSISGFSGEISKLTVEQIENYYTVLVNFAGKTLINEDGTYASETYKKLVEAGKESELAKLLKEKAALCTTKEVFVDTVEEHFAVLAVKHLEIEDIYRTLLEEVNINVISSNPSEKETAVSKIKGNNYNSISEIEEALNKEISSLQNNPSSNPGSSTVPSGSYTPPSGGSFSGGGSYSGGSSSPSGTTVVKPSDNENKEKDEIKFSDISGHWSADDVKSLADKKIINGYPDNTFRPDGNVTRAEAASIIKKAFSYADAEKENDFSDVLKNEWYYSAINTLFEAGVMKGDGNSFKPNEYLTREDLCVLIYRCIKEPEAKGENAFNDSAEISDYALEAVSYLSENAVVQGYEGNFMPKQFVTRGQICAIINRTLKAVNN